MTDLSMVPRELIKQKARVDQDGNTVRYWELHYKLLVSIETGAGMLFSLICGGKEYGKVGPEY